MPIALKMNISWYAGLMWPLIDKHCGEKCYEAKYGHGHNDNIQGLYGYQIFTGLGLVLGDGLYQIVKLLGMTVRDMWVVTALAGSVLYVMTAVLFQDIYSRLVFGRHPGFPGVLWNTIRLKLQPRLLNDIQCSTSHVILIMRVWQTRHDSCRSCTQFYFLLDWW